MADGRAATVMLGLDRLVLLAVSELETASLHALDQVEGPIQAGNTC